MKSHTLKKVISILLCVSFVMFFASCSSQKTMAKKQEVPNNLAVPKSLTRENKTGDIYVSADGDDKNSGTKESPVKTPQRAVELAEKMNKSEKVIYFSKGDSACP